MEIYDKIVFSSTPPTNKGVLWGKPVKDGFAIYKPYGGIFRPLKLMDDAGTLSLDDDTVADISNIPEIVKEAIPEVLGDTVAEVVKEQLTLHDDAVSDTHNAESPDASDYPEVTIF